MGTMRCDAAAAAVLAIIVLAHPAMAAADDAAQRPAESRAAREAVPIEDVARTPQITIEDMASAAERGPALSAAVNHSETANFWI